MGGAVQNPQPFKPTINKGLITIYILINIQGNPKVT